MINSWTIKCISTLFNKQQNVNQFFIQTLFASIHQTIVTFNGTLTCNKEIEQILRKTDIRKRKRKGNQNFN